MTRTGRLTGADIGRVGRLSSERWALRWGERDERTKAGQKRGHEPRTRTNARRNGGEKRNDPDRAKRPGRGGTDGKRETNRTGRPNEGLRLRVNRTAISLGTIDQERRRPNAPADSSHPLAEPGGHCAQGVSGSFQQGVIGVSPRGDPGLRPYALTCAFLYHSAR